MKNLYHAKTGRLQASRFVVCDIDQAVKGGRNL